MGCHTQYRKLVTKDQYLISSKIRLILDDSQYWWYEFENLEDIVESKDEYIQEIGEYIDDNIDEHIVKVNGVYGLYECADEFDIDLPRIGGYPDVTITNIEEMFNVMESGLIGRKGGLYHFTDEKGIGRKNVIAFFEKYPDGIIEFG